MGAVFISYRREDSEGQARALSLELEKLIGEDSVFMDVDSIALGRDFRQALQERLATCDIMLALIGPGWLDARDANGNRRLESPTDFVRQEIASALKRNIRVTPVLLQGAVMPAQERLPDDLKDLAFRNGFELSHTRWVSDVAELVRRLGLGGAGHPNASSQEIRSTQPAPASPKIETIPVTPSEAAPSRRSRKLLTRWLIAGAVLLILAFLMWACSGGVSIGSTPTTTTPDSTKDPAVSATHAISDFFTVPDAV